MPGWTLHDRWLTYDDEEAGAVYLVDLPNNIEVASFAIKSHARGHIKTFRAIPLLAPDDFRVVLRKAATGEVDHTADEVEREAG